MHVNRTAIKRLAGEIQRQFHPQKHSNHGNVITVTLCSIRRTLSASFLLITLSGCATLGIVPQGAEWINITSSPVAVHITLQMDEFGVYVKEKLGERFFKIGQTPCRFWINRPNREGFTIHATPIDPTWQKTSLSYSRTDPTPSEVNFDLELVDKQPTEKEVWYLRYEPLEILSEPRGARIEINNEYVGQTPIKTYYRRGDPDFSITIRALPVQQGHYVQEKVIQPYKVIPRRVFFDMRIKSSQGYIK